MMDRRAVPVLLAVAGLAVTVIGVYQGLLHVAPGYEGTVMTGWDGELNHEERLLVGLAAVGVGGAAATRRWKRLAAVPVAMGGVVLFYALRATIQKVLNVPLYTETTIYSGDAVVFVLGAEPFLLVAAGLLLVGAGVAGWRRHAWDTGADEASTSAAA
jgi:hypothetical protein